MDTQLTVVSGNLTWRLNGDLASAVVARGLHHDVGSGIHDPKVPAWLREMRKRTFAAAYGLDIGLASFTGRPPRLLKRYCDISYLLDIPMKHLAEPDFDFTRLSSHLDSHGWNTDNHVEGASLLRAGLNLNMIREDIVDFALTATSQLQDPGRTASDIYRSCQQVWESLPAFLKLSANTSFVSNDFVIPRLQFQPHLPWGPTTTYLNYLYNFLLLERASLRHIPTRSKYRLVQTSRVIISTLLDLLQPPSKQSALSTTATSTAITNPWIIVKYGVPASGVLCLELLLERQRLMRGQTATNTANTTTNDQGEEEGLGQFCSEVIQNLSRFVRCLDSHVTPFHGNYQICRQSRTLIRRILDKILDPIVIPNHLVQYQDQYGYQPMQQLHQQQEYGEQQQPLSEMEFWEKTLPDHPLLRDT